MLVASSKGYSSPVGCTASLGLIAQKGCYTLGHAAGMHDPPGPPCPEVHSRGCVWGAVKGQQWSHAPLLYCGELSTAHDLLYKVKQHQHCT